MSDASLKARLWWSVAELIGRPPPASLAAPYREAIASVQRASRGEKSRRAQQLAAQLALALDPPVAAWLAAHDPSHLNDVATAMDPRVVAIAMDGAPQSHPAALVAWCKQSLAAQLEPSARLTATPPWLARYDGLPWQPLQTLLRRDAATHLCDAAAVEPGLVDAMAHALPDDEAVLLRRTAGVMATTSPDLPWPNARRATLLAWRNATTKTLLAIAIQIIATLPMDDEHRRSLWQRLPKAMIPSLGE